MPPAANVLAPGPLLPRFFLIRGLGEDENLSVPHRTFHAFDLESARSVVLQLAPSSPSRLGTFARSLQHCQDLGQGDLSSALHGEVIQDQALLASSHCHGVTLRELLRGGSLQPELANQILWDIAQALATLHLRGISHGDLHSRNVRITPEGNVVLVGWMPAQIGSPDTRPGPEAKVRSYAPPEVLKGGPPSPPGDLYSLGLILVEMFAGRPILPRGSIKETLRGQRTLQASLPKVIRLARKAPQEIQDLLQSLLQFEPHHRPEDGTRVVNLLIQILRTPMAKKKFQKLLHRPLQGASEHVQRLRMKQVREELHAGNALAAASLLVDAAVLSSSAGNRYRDRLRNLTRQTFWLGFLPQPGETPGIQVLYCMLREAASQLEDSPLGALALVRLGQFVDETSPLRALLPSLSGLGNSQRQIDGYLQTLQDRPTDEQALLGLAVRTPGFHVDSEQDLGRVKSELLCHHGLFQQALFYRTQDLFQDPDLPRALAEIRDLAQKSIDQILASSHPSTISQPPRPFDPLETYVPTGGKRDLRSLLELHLSSSPVPEPSSSPDFFQDFSTPDLASSTPLPRFDSVPSRSDHTPRPAIDPEVLFTRAQILLCEGDLDEATKIFREIQEADLEEGSPYLEAIASEFRQLIWKALLEPEKECLFENLEKIWGLIRTMDMPSLQLLCEHLVVRSLPETNKGEILAELVRQSPTSLPFLQQASTHALEHGDRNTWARHLLMAGWQFLENTDLLAAAKLLSAAGTQLPPETLQPALKELLRRGEETARIGVLFRERMAPHSQAGRETFLYDACKLFLEEFPDFLPALEGIVELATLLARPSDVVEESMALAQRALLREDTQEAQRLLASILESEWDQDEALLQLAAMRPLRPDPDEDLEIFRIRLLKREELYQVAMHRGRKLLKGGFQDRQIHMLLGELCELAGEDPSPHYLKVGLISLEFKDIPRAREFLDKAIVSSPTPGPTIEQLASIENISFAYSPLDMARLRSKFSSPG